MTRTRGTTLIELMVALLILSLSAGLAALSVQSLRPTPADEHRRELDRLKREAIRTGRPVRVLVDSMGPEQPHLILFLPDGRTLGETDHAGE